MLKIDYIGVEYAVVGIDDTVIDGIVIVDTGVVADNVVEKTVDDIGVADIVDKFDAAVFVDFEG